MTEFLPVSSSGHLVIFQTLFGMTEPQVFFDVMLHVGTLAAVVIVFRRDLLEIIQAGLRMVTTPKAAMRRAIQWGQSRIYAAKDSRRNSWDSPHHDGETASVGGTAAERMLLAIIIGSIPTGLIGVLFADQFERMFGSMTSAGVGLLITGSVLMLTEWRAQISPVQATDGSGGVGFKQALIIGVAQGIAIAPGISRSGSTIAVALLLGVPREVAARFSFLLSLPAICGAVLFELKDFSPAQFSGAAVDMPAVTAGAVTAAIVGIFALLALLKVVRQGRISLFAYYCWGVGLLAIAAGLLKNS